MWAFLIGGRMCSPVWFTLDVLVLSEVDSDGPASGWL